MKQEFMLFGLHPIAYSDEYLAKVDLYHKVKWLRYSEKYADFLYSRLDQNQLGLRPYFKWRMMVNPDNYSSKYTQHNTPLIMHSPSNREIKGTKYILEAIQKLRDEGLKFQFELIENLPQKV
jgi:hypothetical protein